MDTIDLVVADVVRDEMINAARIASEELYKRHGGDHYACGFAWVTVYPHNKGNTRAGRAERKVLKDMGFKQDWTGKGYEYWNPGGLPVQNIDIKEAGANAAAVVLRKYGFKAYSNSRLD